MTQKDSTNHQNLMIRGFFENKMEVADLTGIFPKDYPRKLNNMFNGVNLQYPYLLSPCLVPSRAGSAQKMI